MSLAQLVGLALQISIGLTMFGLGLVTRREAVLYLWRHPLQLGWSLAAMFLVVRPLTLSPSWRCSFWTALQVVCW